MPHSFRLFPSDSGGGPPEPDCLENVMFASHLDGANGSTTVINDGDPANSGSFNGAATIDTADSKFGTSSGFIASGVTNPNEESLSTNNMNYHSGVTTLTAELWFKFTGSISDTDAGGILNIGGNSIQVFKSDNGGASELRVNAGGSSVNIGAYPVGIWTHLAVTVSDTQTMFWVDGVLKYTKSTSFSWTQVDVFFGRNSGTEFGGYIDELIVTDEVKYTANFTPPTQPYTICP